MSAAPPQAPVPAPSAEAAEPAFEPSTLAGTPDGRASSTSVDVALFAGGTYVAQGIQFVAGLLQKGILGPAGAGLWALMQSFWTFMSISSLGAQPGATRQVPMHRGRGDLRAAEASADTAATFALAMMAVLGLVLVLVALVLGGSWDTELRWSLVLLGLTAPLRLLADTQEVLIQSVKRFDVASATVVLQAGVSLVLTTLAALAFGVYGMFAGVALMAVASMLFWRRVGVVSRAVPAFRLRVDRARLKELIGFGFPILVYAQVWLLFAATDSLVVASALSVEQLGYYALAGSVTQYILFLPKSVGGAVAPRMAETYGRTGRLADIHHFATDVQRLLAYVLVPLAIGAAFFGFPVLIRHALPDFEPAVDVLQVIVAASFFMALMNMPIKVLITAGYRWSITAIAFACLLMNVGLNLLFVVALDLGLQGAAAATACSYFATFLLTTGFGLSRAMSARHTALHLGEIVLVFAWLYGALRGIEAVVGAAPGNVFADAGVAALKLLLLVVVMSPWLHLAERRVQGVSRLLGIGGKLVAGARRR